MDRSTARQTSSAAPRSRPARTHSSASALVTGLVAALLATFGQAGTADATSMISYVHAATSANITGPSDELTELDNPVNNDNPDARILVTQNWDPAGAGGVYNPHVVGLVYYADFSGGGSWYIRNQDGGTISEGAAFNVLILGPDTLSFVHLTSSANTSGRASTLDPFDPDCLLCPHGTRILYTPTQSAFGLEGGAFDHHSAVLYGSPSYALVTESRVAGTIEPMPTGVLFNVLIADSPGVASSPGTSFVHTASAGTITADWTTITNPALDGDWNAVFFVNLAGPVDTRVPHPLGVYYTAGLKWSIFFEDDANMIPDTYYNVYIPPILSDGFESGDPSWWSSAAGATTRATARQAAAGSPSTEQRDPRSRLDVIAAHPRRR